MGRKWSTLEKFEKGNTGYKGCCLLLLFPTIRYYFAMHYVDLSIQILYWKSLCHYGGVSTPLSDLYSLSMEKADERASYHYSVLVRYLPQKIMLTRSDLHERAPVYHWENSSFLLEY